MEAIADDQGALEKNQHSLHFLDRDRAYLIAEVNPTLANQVWWPQRNADSADMFLFMLKSQWITDKYYEEYPNSDFTELWEVRENRGVNSQGGLRKYADKHGMDYNRLRDIVQVTQKARAIEAEMETPGLSKSMYFAFKRLRAVRFEQIGPFCVLFRTSESFEKLKHYAPKALALWNDYAAIIDQHRQNR
ncbi:hypothetical protein TSTA_108130 [Talaromyces stipitatus ATCC 10500]|uniref:Uncharacterized protein n=1 Tax=Talaromyces stipitatus (strain ATCC 10500 / CBS 375.48 / QM 6759 / NRRL 1006) TaxID=441959 RepID=B8MUC0_TALSN|nr:uncharacterized protein TSTA_108130 [Talaromyces stipitatus ATCC 10500]EED11624.1 hypothetical protein TSTA_108130 [Talaromyces stipitatus ATCC 10500]